MSQFELRHTIVDLELKQPFTIARGTKETVSNVLVELSSGSYTGYGEAGPNARYDETADTVIDFINDLPDNFFDEINTAYDLAAKLDYRENLVQSAKAALEMAWLDWWGKKQNQPVWKLWNAPGPAGQVTSYTIGLDEIEVMQQKVQKTPEYPIYKVKLGTDRDREIIESLREVTDKPIRVDANEGWTTLDEAKRIIEFLATQNIELIEQPMPAGHFEDHKKLKAFSPIPLCADESFMGSENIAHIAEAFDIINIKLMKIGSLIKAKKVIEKAKKNNLKVMIGCMIESSIANTAGALLSLWADYADLDGHLLIKKDLAEGLRLTEEKKVVLPDRPGLGIKIL